MDLQNSALSVNKKVLPDVSVNSQPSVVLTLDKVGMQRIEVPANIELLDKIITVPAKVDAFVNLKNPSAKGIHMSRLYKVIARQMSEKTLSFETLESILNEILKGHSDLSDEAFIRVEFEYIVQRKALMSNEMGWRQYPVVLSARLKNKKLTKEIETHVFYSSTCPCSAALARQLITEKFDNDFNSITNINKSDVLAWLTKESSIAAVPHSQRSEAKIKVKVSDKLKVMDIIDVAEMTLATPVQSAVRRIDEQEFARLNAANLMFCEDAARKLKNVLNSMTQVTDFKLSVHHYESLHAHDAVAMATKGIADGYSFD